MKKYKLFIDVLLVLLCLFPLIYSLFAIWHVGATDTTLLLDTISSLNINPSMASTFESVLSNSFEIETNSAWQAVTVIMANSVMVYICYVVVEVFVFVPKMAIKLLRIGVRKDD